MDGRVSRKLLATFMMIALLAASSTPSAWAEERQPPVLSIKVTGVGLEVSSPSDGRTYTYLLRTGEEVLLTASYQSVALAVTNLRLLGFSADAGAWGEYPFKGEQVLGYGMTAMDAYIQTVGGLYRFYPKTAHWTAYER